MGWSFGGGGGAGGGSRSFGVTLLDDIVEAGQMAAYYPFSTGEQTYPNVSPTPKVGDLGTTSGGTPNFSLVNTGLDGFGVRAVDNDAAEARTGLLSGQLFSEFTINVWYAPVDATPPANKSIVALSPGSDNSNGFVVGNATDGSVYLYAFGAFRFFSSPGDLSSGVMSMLTLVKKVIAGTPTMLLYLNGSLVNSFVGSFGFEGYDLRLNRFGTLGSGQAADWSALSMYSKGFDASEVSALWGGGSGAFYELAA